MSKRNQKKLDICTEEILKEKSIVTQSIAKFGINNMAKELTTREKFMSFFRDDEKLNLLSVDDRLEIFSQILLGKSDFTKEFLDEVLSDYDVSHLIIIETKNVKR